MEQDALKRWLEKRKKTSDPDEEFLEILAETMRDPGIMNGK